MAIDLRLRGKFDMFRKHKYWLICAVVGAAAVVSLKLAQRGHAPATLQIISKRGGMLSESTGSSELGCASCGSWRHRIIKS